MYMRPAYQMQAQVRYEDMQKLFYTRDQAIAKEIMKRYEINYILVDKKHKQRLRFPREGILEKVYLNEEIEIYEVSGSKQDFVKIS